MEVIIFLCNYYGDLNTYYCIDNNAEQSSKDNGNDDAMDKALEEQAPMERSPPPSTTNSFQSQHEPVNALQEISSSSTIGSTACFLSSSR